MKKTNNVRDSGNKRTVIELKLGETSAVMGWSVGVRKPPLAIGKPILVGELAGKVEPGRWQSVRRESAFPPRRRGTSQSKGHNGGGTERKR